MSVYIGTSGFSYAYWKNRFYPEKLPASQWLAYYSTRFSTLELNNTFYRFPSVKNLKRMADMTPEDFRFSVKMNRHVTHTLRMKQVQEEVQAFTDTVREGLGSKLSCILYQLPPSYTYSGDRMDDILANVRHERGHVIEFRHPSWWQERVYVLLRECSLTFCSVSYPGLPGDNVLTGSLFYRRMHGIPELFRSAYTEAALETLAQGIPADADAFIYFNNTMFDAGYTNAGRLQDLVRRR